jgi:hypothetical protein
VILSSLDDYITRQPSLVTRKRQLLPVVVQRMQIAEGLAKHLERLGIERRAKQLDIAAQLAALHRPPATVDSSGESGTPVQREEAAPAAGPVVGEPEKQEP